MSEETLSDRQRELAAAAAAAARRHGRAIDLISGEAGVGEVFVLEATSDFPVEWALLERRGAEGPFLAVPGDSHPFLGSRDVEVETSTGLLILRCQAGLWLEASSFDPDLRVGALEPDDLERARRKVREVSQEGFAPDPFLEEVDRSPEYEAWMRDVIQPARAVADSREAAPETGRRPRLSRWMAVAAVLAVACFGLTVQVVRQQRQIEGLAAQPLLNPLVAILQPAEVLRGTDARTYELPSAVPTLTVVLRFRETEIYPAYRLILTREGNARPVWSTDGLERSPEGVQLVLPQRLIPPGRYRLSLSGLGAGEARPIAEYELTIGR